MPPTGRVGSPGRAGSPPGSPLQTTADGARPHARGEDTARDSPPPPEACKDDLLSNYDDGTGTHSSSGSRASVTGTFDETADACQQAMRRVGPQLQEQLQAVIEDQRKKAELMGSIPPPLPKAKRRRISDAERAFKCAHESCEKAYTTKGALNTHMKTKHGEVLRSDDKDLPPPSDIELSRRLFDMIPERSVLFAKWNSMSDANMLRDELFKLFQLLEDVKAQLHAALLKADVALLHHKGVSPMALAHTHSHAHLHVHHAHAHQHHVHHPHSHGGGHHLDDKGGSF